MISDLDKKRKEFYARYEEDFPSPKVVAVSNSVAGWSDGWRKMFIGGFVAIVLMTIVSAGARTGIGVYNVAILEGFSESVALIITIVTVGSIEGYAALFGMFRDRSSILDSDSSKLQKFYESFWGWFSFILSIVISSMSGLFFSINIDSVLAGQWSGLIAKLLSLSMGIGLTLIVAGVADFAGHYIFIIVNGKIIAINRHQKKMEEYNERRLQAWVDSPAYLLAHGDDLVVAEQYRAMRKNASRGIARAMQERNRAVVGSAPLVSSNAVGVSKSGEKSEMIKLAHRDLQQSLGRAPEYREVKEYLENLNDGKLPVSASYLSETLKKLGGD